MDGVPSAESAVLPSEGGLSELEKRGNRKHRETGMFSMYRRSLGPNPEEVVHDFNCIASTIYTQYMSL